MGIAAAIIIELLPALVAGALALFVIVGMTVEIVQALWRKFWRAGE